MVSNNTKNAAFRVVISIFHVHFVLIPMYKLGYSNDYIYKNAIFLHFVPTKFGKFSKSIYPPIYIQ